MDLYHRGLYYLTPPNDTTDPHNRGSLIRCKLFTDEEIDVIDSAVILMERLFFNVDRIVAVRDAYNEFAIELSSLCSDNKYAIARVDRRARAYYMEFRLFLDHWKKYISDQKKQKEPYGATYEKLYKDVTSDAYDQCDEYVLATVIRNYVVHGYDAINHCYVGTSNNEVFISRDALFKIDVAKSAKPIIEKQAEEINLLTVAEKSFGALVKVQNQLMDYQLTAEIENAAELLINVINKINDAGIKANVWYMFENFKPPQKSGKEDAQSSMVNGFDASYRPIKWSSYIDIANYIIKLWNDGYWKDVQKKYGPVKS